MLLDSTSVRWRYGLLAILPLVVLAQWKYGRDAEVRVRLHFVSNDGEQVIYSLRRHGWLHHHSTGRFDADEVTLVRKSPDRVTRQVLPIEEYSDIQISPDEILVATVTPTGRLAIRNLATGRMTAIKQLAVGRTENLELYFNSDGRYLAAQAFLPSQWLLQVMDTETLQVTQNIGSRWTIAARIRHDRLFCGTADGSGKNPKLINRRFAALKGGELCVSDEEVPDDIFDISPSGRFVVCGKENLGAAAWQIVDRVSQTHRIIPVDKLAPAVFAPHERELLVLRGDQIQRIDLISGKSLSPYRLEKEYAYGYLLSMNGRYLAIHTLGDAIEIWDLDAGKRIDRHSTAPRRWTFWVAAIVGTITWCGAWLASAGKRHTTFRTCADILILTIVGGIGFYLRRLFAGDPNAYYRMSLLATSAMMYGISALGSFWLVYGKGRWSWRFPGYLAGMSLVWFAPVWIWHRYQLPGGYFPIAVLGMSAFVIAILMVQLRRGFRLVRLTDSPTFPLAQAGNAHQVPLRDLLAVPGATGLVIVVAKLVERPTNLVPWLLCFGVLRCICQAIIVVVAIHTALSPSRPLRRYLAGFILIGAFSLVAPLAFHSASTLLPWSHFAAMDSVIGLYVLLALLLIRRRSWRFSRLPTRES